MVLGLAPRFCAFPRERRLAGFFEFQNPCAEFHNPASELRILVSQSASDCETGTVKTQRWSVAKGFTKEIVIPRPSDNGIIASL